MEIRDTMLPVLGPKGGKEEIQALQEVIESGFYSNIQVDHKDGDPSNNDPENLQSLCGCCHDFKSRASGDMVSPGRKSLGLTANGTPRMVETQNQI